MSFQLVRVEAPEPGYIPKGARILCRGSNTNHDDQQVPKQQGVPKVPKAEPTQKTGLFSSFQELPSDCDVESYRNAIILPKDEWVSQPDTDELRLLPHTYYYELVFSDDERDDDPFNGINLFWSSSLPKVRSPAVAKYMEETGIGLYSALWHSIANPRNLDEYFEEIGEESWSTPSLNLQTYYESGEPTIPSKRSHGSEFRYDPKKNKMEHVNLDSRNAKDGVMETDSTADVDGVSNNENMNPPSPDREGQPIHPTFAKDANGSMLGTIKDEYCNYDAALALLERCSFGANWLNSRHEPRCLAEEWARREQPLVAPETAPLPPPGNPGKKNDEKKIVQRETCSGPGDEFLDPYGTDESDGWQPPHEDRVVNQSG